MYKVISVTNGEDVGLVEEPRYIKYKNDIFVRTTKEDAIGVAVNSIPYNLFGHSEIENADTVLLVETDSAKEIVEQVEVMDKQRVTSDIAFVIMAEAGTIDEVTATEHIDSFSKWAYPIKYQVGNIRKYRNELYRCILEHTSQVDWAPDVSVTLWLKIGDPTVEYPLWSQPIGAHDAYSLGDKVTHNERKWQSIVDNNVWEPGLYGWEEVTEEV